MILLAVIVGYILGIAPFVVPKILELRKNKVVEDTNKEDSKTQNEIFDEWLNGPKQEVNTNQVNQEEIYNEYITGIVTRKGA